LSDLLIRPLTAADLDLFNHYPDPPTSGVGGRSRTFDEYVAVGDYRPEWTWVALRGGVVIARAAFWGPPQAPHPFSLDWFDPGTGPDRVDVGAALLRTAYAAIVANGYTAAPHPDAARPDYHLFLPAGWRERPDAYADATDRIAAAEQAGLHRLVERLNLRWRAADGLPPRSTRLRFTPAPHDPVVADVLVRVCTGTLDSYATRDVARYGLRRACELTVDEVAGMPGERHWWRLAYHASGELVGLVLPTRNSATATLGYLGVVPEHRGHHYCDDLLAEALHIFTETGETEVTDSTDVDNAPMAASFARIGYTLTGRRIIFT